MKRIQGTYAELLRHPKWTLLRKQILERDGNKCRGCGAASQLQVHHRQYHRCKASGLKLAPWCYDAKYLVTLCDSCHKSGHQRLQVPQFSI